MPRGSIHMTYYLCAGAPVADRSLDRKIDSMRLEGQGRLDGWRLTFTREGGRANLAPAADGKVWGLLYLIEEGKLPLLDAVEAGGERRSGTVYFEGHREKCVFYVHPSRPGKPADGELEAFREAYRQAGLPQAQIDQALGLARA